MPVPSINTLIIEQFRIVHNRYRVIKLMSRGGESYLYLVQDTMNYNQVCVLKQMYHNPEELSGIENEYQLFSGLFHPNIVQVLDFFWEERIFYIVMNYVAGQTLKDYLHRRGEPLDEIKVLNWGLKLASILQFLHNREVPIFHADVAPENIMVSPNNNDLVLIDFGIARAGYEAVGLREKYSAPEQLDGILDASCDVYSLGATLYKCLTLREQPEPGADPRLVNPNVSPPTAELIMKATAKSKTAFMGLVKSRYENMEELVDAIQDCFVSNRDKLKLA